MDFFFSLIGVRALFNSRAFAVVVLVVVAAVVGIAATKTGFRFSLVNGVCLLAAFGAVRTLKGN